MEILTNFQDILFKTASQIKIFLLIFKELTNVLKRKKDFSLKKEVL